MIQVINRAVEILQFVAKSSEPIRLREIARATGLAPATCSNILSSLTEKRLLTQSGQRRNYAYKIGRLIFELSGSISFTDDLVAVSQEPMTDFTRRTDTSCILTVLEGRDRILLHEVKTNSRLQVLNGDRIPAYSSATGRTILAHLSKSRLDQFIKHHGVPSESEWPGVITEAGLRRELESIRAGGMIARVSVDQIFGVSAAIHDAASVIAGIGAYLPDAYYTDAKALLIKQVLQECVQAIEEGLQKLH